jgi:hypothetical protein
MTDGHSRQPNWPNLAFFGHTKRVEKWHRFAEGMPNGYWARIPVILEGTILQLAFISL